LIATIGENASLRLAITNPHTACHEVLRHGGCDRNSDFDLALGYHRRFRRQSGEFGGHPWFNSPALPVLGDNMAGWRSVAFGVLMGGATCAVGAAAPLPPDSPAARQEAERLNKLPAVPAAPPGHIDHSGRTQKGRASYYAHHFAHRKMADGRRMNPNSNVAASKNLPLGSVAKVTNLDNGKTATVKVEDRGPYVKGRVVDVAPRVADQLDLKQKGVGPVEVKPITVPQPDGGVKLGAGAADASREEVNQAVAVTQTLVGSNNTETAEK
jgi:rare lipoprotein A